MIFKLLHVGKVSKILKYIRLWCHFVILYIIYNIHYSRSDREVVKPLLCTVQLTALTSSTSVKRTSFHSSWSSINFAKLFPFLSFLTLQGRSAAEGICNMNVSKMT
jgi:hypothetical protein